MNKKRFLFYLVHPAKFQFHKVQINNLMSKGHHVDIVINTKDILEELVKEEGWEYKNIFPKSRKIKGVHVYIAAIISIFKSVYRLWRFTKNKKYDLFIGDLTTILGRLIGVHSLYPNDDVLTAVPELAIFFKTANYIIAPEVTNIGKYVNKKISYKGYKALAHLHPNHFTPDINRLPPNLQNRQPYFLIRCTGFGATHDIDKTGITDELLFLLEKILLPHGEIFITTERQLPDSLKKYVLNCKKNDMAHFLAFAKIFIGDSTTMSTEAAILGTPSIEFDDYFFEIDQMMEIEQKYNLIHCYRTNQQTAMLQKVNDLLNTTNLREIYHSRRKLLLSDTIDVSEFLIWVFESYPQSANEYFSNPNIQDRFR